MKKLVYTIHDSFNKTTLPGYHMTEEAARKRMEKIGARKGRLFISRDYTAKEIHEGKPDYPIVEFKVKAPGKFE